MSEATSHRCNPGPLPIVLASASPSRRALLQQAGVRFSWRRPEFEESLEVGVEAEHVALSLAEGKAGVVAPFHPDAIVIACDQVGDSQGQLLGKPSDAAVARIQLAMLQGKTHRLVTGLVVIGPTPATGGSRPIIRHLEVTTLLFRNLLDGELDAYVATGEWEGCAGGYRIEGRGAQLVERIDGDYFNILGLPLIPLLAILRRMGHHPLLHL